MEKQFINYSKSLIRYKKFIKYQSTVAQPSTQHEGSHTSKNVSQTIKEGSHKDVMHEAKSKNVDSKSFAMNIFKGIIKHEEIFPYKNVLNEDQLSILASMVEPTDIFLKEQNNPEINDNLEAVELKTLEGLKQLGAFGLQAPEKYGGLGLNNTQYARLVEMIGYSDLGIAVILGAHQSIGFKGITLFGTEEQKMKYLPLVASGEHLAAFALTEPGSGSDANSIRCQAIMSEDKSHFILNGSKIWISNGGVANVFTVFAKTPVTSEAGVTKEKVSAFIVERSFGGLTSGPPERKMGIKASNTAEVYFENVKIPKENLLGELGEGFKIAMAILNNGRFGMAAAMSGTMKACIKQTVEFSKNRIQFGKTIDQFGGVQEKIARMCILQYVTESMAYILAGNMDSGSKEYQVEAAISKVYGSEAAWYVVDEAIQILGGSGFMKDVGLERVMRDLRIFRIFEGTNDILRLFVALTGIQFAGNHLKELQRTLKNPKSNLGLISGEVFKRAKRLVGMATIDSLVNQVHPELFDSSKLLTASIENFGIAVESLLIKYGKHIIDEQFLLNRLANSAIEIYCMAVVLSRATASLNHNLASAEYESIIAKVVCNEGQVKIAEHLRLAKSDNANKKYYEQLSLLSKQCVAHGSTVPVHPLGF